MKISLVIPSYQEEKRIQHSVKIVREFIWSRPEICEVLYVVESSSDKTLEEGLRAQEGEKRIRIIDNKVHLGKGYAVKSGMLKAVGDIVFFMDVDLSTPLIEIDRFSSEFRKNPHVDVLIGSRSELASSVTIRQSKLREALGRGFNRIVRGFVFRGFLDTQCGFKAFRKEVVETVFPLQQTVGFAFDVEVLMLAQRLGFNIQSVPVQWANQPDSRVSLIRDSMSMLYDVLRMKSLVSKSLKLREMPSKASKDKAA